MAEERYEIRGKIGQGGVGAVYKAYDTQLRREVAIKRVIADEEDANNETATQNLLQEATALSSVQHPHICTVYDSGIDDDGPFVVMELINGKTLDEMVERGTLTYEDFREVALQCQEAMIAAQELNLVHRDLKPSNVMVSWLPSGRFQIKLVDFGLAKFSAKPSLQTIDHGDAVFGSIYFMAPEQFERTALDQRTDMYSLGAMFYYSLTGKYPFDGETAPQVMASHLQSTVIPLQQARPDLPTWLCEWVMWHIQKDMEHRPPSAKLALDKFLADESLAAQGGMGQTQKLITPGAPVLKKNTTGVVTTTPANNITGPLAVQPATPTSPTTPTLITPANTPTLTPTKSTTTEAPIIPTPANPTLTPAQPNTSAIQPSPPKTASAPQPLLSPSGAPSPSTSPVAIQPAGNLGSTTVNITTTQPGAPAEPTAEAPAQEFIMPPKKTKTVPIVIASMLAVATIIMCIFIFGAKKEKDHQDTYSSLIKNIESKDTLPVTKEELENLLKSMTKDTIKDKIGGYYALSKATAKNGDFSPTEEIAKFATIPDQPIEDESMRQIFRAIKMNPNHDPEAHKLILEYAVRNPNKPHSADAINRMKDFADDSFIDDILTVYDKTTETATRVSCANTIAQIIKRSRTKSSIAASIIQKYNSVQDEDKKLAYMRLLGTTGSKESINMLVKALSNDKPAFKTSAFKALSTSPNLIALEPMLKVYSAEQKEPQLMKYRKDLFELLESNEKLPEPKQIEAWMKMYNASPTERSRQHVLTILSRTDQKWVAKAFNKILSNQDTKGDIKNYATEKLEEWQKKKIQ